MHLPRNRKVEYVWWYRRLNGHHLLHHRYMNRNLNVVLPFADWLFGTLLLRSPVKFKEIDYYSKISTTDIIKKLKNTCL